jgi:site-specific recombinase XerD
MGDALPQEEHVSAFAVHSFFARNNVLLDKKVYALTADLFSWLEDEWQLPLLCAEVAKPPLPSPVELTKETYTVPELNHLYGVAGAGHVLSRYAIKAAGMIANKGRSAAVYSAQDLAPLVSRLSTGLAGSPVLTEEAYTIEEFLDLFPGADHRYCYKLVRRYGLVPVGSRPSPGRPIPLYKREDLKPAVVQWEGDRLIKILNEWWRRFFPPACQRCDCCQQHARNPLLQQVMCHNRPILNQLRFAVASFLREVLRLGSVTRWWSVHRTDAWERESNAAWGVIFLYLLDRRLLTLSIGDILRIKSLYSMRNEDRIRLWKRRYPQEYQQFCTALQATNYRDSAHEFILKILSLLVLLRYGLANLAELGHPLSQDELHQACKEHRLVTLHLSHGMFLPFPLSNDICIGHVILDEIRMYFWEYAAQQERDRRGRATGPRHWKHEFVRALEQALAAPMYGEKKSILSRRPEIEHPLPNPLCLQQKGVREENSYVLLPPAVQEHMMVYVIWCYQEQELAVSTLQSRVTALLHFFTWGRLQGLLIDYPQWNREKTHQVFRSYESIRCLEMTANSRSGQLTFLASFFTNLRKLECMVPDGYHILSLMAKGRTWEPRVLPQEVVFDRIFHDGVRQLSYDPLARLALTIQYYCGTRVTETCELHLFCLLEDQQEHAYLLIPLGKTKQERPFPVAAVGMEYLLEYMDQVVSLRLAADGTSRTLGQTNLRYAKEDPERANNWHYLFDRVPIAEGRRKKTRGRLSGIRVSEALREALRFAAKRNTDGLFQPGTYSPLCQHRRSKGKECRYFATEDGITLCPRCGSHLSGHRGSYCHHILEEDFVCDGVARTEEEVFCPKCDAPLALFVDL